MSIIYDALKKLEKSGNIKAAAQIDKKPKMPRPRAYLLYILIACLGVFMVNLFFNFFKEPLSRLKDNVVVRQAKVDETPPIFPLPPPSLEDKEPQLPLSTAIEPVIQKQPLVLNGIFFSEEEGYALINNQIVRLDEEIEGAVLKRITPDEVELESAGSIIRLSTNK